MIQLKLGQQQQAVRLGNQVKVALLSNPKLDSTSKHLTPKTKVVIPNQLYRHKPTFLCRI